MPTEAKLGLVLGIGLTMALAFCLKGKEPDSAVKAAAPLASIGQSGITLPASNPRK